MSFSRKISFHGSQGRLYIDIKPSYGDDGIYKDYAEATFDLHASGKKWSGSCWLDENEMHPFRQGLLLLRRREGIAKLTCALSPEFHIAIKPSTSNDDLLIEGGMAEFSYMGEYCFAHPHFFAFEITQEQVVRAGDLLSSIPRKRPPSSEPEFDFSSWIGEI
jgi:hypothetical protein